MQLEYGQTHAGDTGYKGFFWKLTIMVDMMNDAKMQGWHLFKTQIFFRWTLLRWNYLDFQSYCIQMSRETVLWRKQENTSKPIRKKKKDCKTGGNPIRGETKSWKMFSILCPLYLCVCSPCCDVLKALPNKSLLCEKRDLSHLIQSKRKEENEP